MGIAMTIVTIPNTNLDTVVGHSTTAVKLTNYRNGFGSCKGVDKDGHTHWFVATDIRKIKEV